MKRAMAAAPGLPVVLVHGWSGSYAKTWQGGSLERKLEAAGRPIVRLDLPGHGAEQQSHEPQEYAGIAESLLLKFPAEPIVDAVGFSLGGKLLLELAARYPARFRRLVIAGAGTNLFRPEAGAMISQAPLASSDAEIPPILRAIVAEARASGNDLHALSAVIRRPPKLMEPDDLRKITAFMLLIAGSDDTLIGNAKELHASLPGSEFLLLDGVDHLGTPSSLAFQQAAADFLLA